MSIPRLTLVTGATGFVGAAVARNLQAKGWPLRLMTRPESDTRNLAGLDAEIIHGDLTEPTTLSPALRGCDALFHVAADYRIWVPDATRMDRINISGTRALMQAALDQGVQRIVYTSSVATLGRTGDGAPADEETPVTLHDMIGVYKRSKYLAEQAVRDMVAMDQLPCVIVNPSTPVGPGDVKPTPTGRMILDAARGKMPAYVDTGLNIVHVDDVAEGHALAFAHGAIGERYVLGGANLHLREILTLVAAAANRAAPTLALPVDLLWPVAWGAEQLARLTGREPMLTCDALRMAKKKMFFNSDKAEAKLGYRHRAAEAAVRDAVAWFRINGYL